MTNQINLLCSVDGCVYCRREGKIQISERKNFNTETLFLKWAQPKIRVYS